MGWSNEFGNACCRARRTIGFDCTVLSGAANLLGDGRSDHLGCGRLKVHAAAGSVAF